MRTIRSNNLLTFPRLTTSLITKKLPESEASLKGHLAQEQKKLHSTKTPSQEDNNEDLHSKQESDNIKTNKMLCSMFPVSDTNQLSKYSDQNSGIPVRLATGKIYMYVLYHYDINSIHAVPIKSRHEDHMIQA